MPNIAVGMKCNVCNDVFEIGKEGWIGHRMIGTDNIIYVLCPLHIDE